MTKSRRHLLDPPQLSIFISRAPQSSGRSAASQPVDTSNNIGVREKEEGRVKSKHLTLAIAPAMREEWRGRGGWSLKMPSIISAPERMPVRQFFMTSAVAPAIRSRSSALGRARRKRPSNVCSFRSVDRTLWDGGGTNGVS